MFYFLAHSHWKLLYTEVSLIIGFRGLACVLQKTAKPDQRSSSTSTFWIFAQCEREVYDWSAAGVAGLVTNSILFCRSRVGVRKCVFNKRTNKVCVRCSWQFSGTSAPSMAHLVAENFCISAGSDTKMTESLGGTEEHFPWRQVIDLSSRQINYFFTKGNRRILS